jgi:hypothetical protein
MVNSIPHSFLTSSTGHQVWGVFVYYNTLLQLNNIHHFDPFH